MELAFILYQFIIRRSFSTILEVKLAINLAKSWLKSLTIGYIPRHRVSPIMNR